MDRIPRSPRTSQTTQTRQTRRIQRITLLGVFGAALGAALPAPAAHAEAKKPAAKKEVAPVARKAKPRTLTPVSAEHKKALAKLLGGFKLGATKDEVIAVFSKQLDERYDEKIKATTDITAQDQLRRDKRNEVNRLRQSYISFDTAKPSPWDVSIVEEEFAHNTGESMLERWENQDGKNQRRFFFFYEGKLWKMFVSLDVSILSEDNKSFAAFRSKMEALYGPGDVEDGKITWRTDAFDVRAIDKLKSYDALALAIEDPRVRKQVEASREAKAPPRRETNSVIKAVIDTDHKDHPDVKSNSDAVDSVIRAQGGTPPAPKK
ncbi:MAG TPA: hypothetical protein VFT22_13220 [Kofleriaceae bacterium]|nr:hypothetical protein [Kofleriaceae bacterium]